MAAARDPWRILGIPPGSGEGEIRRAYLGLVRRHHPDQFPHGSPEARWHEERLKEVIWAYHEVRRRTSSAASRPAASPPPPRRPSFRLHCEAHQRWAVIYCTTCGAPLCSRCDPALTGYCGQHRRQRVRM
ncbi:MAG: J domain-containing protein [Firmicutes bacterium]|nr:J domain-containing protein [Bacillota bacterium]